MSRDTVPALPGQTAQGIRGEGGNVHSLQFLGRDWLCSENDILREEKVNALFLKRKARKGRGWGRAWDEPGGREPPWSGSDCTC